jgi:quercetin dioxygenase-like cupin family protein
MEATNSEPGALEERDAFPCMDSVIRLLVAGDRTEGRFALLEVVESRGASHPLHVHSREDEVVYVLEGGVRFYLDGDATERPAGESMLLPKDHEHTYAITSERARLLVMVIPAGLEEYFHDLAQSDGGRCVYQEAERLVVIAARYGVDITGPSPTLEGGGEDGNMI